MKNTNNNFNNFTYASNFGITHPASANLNYNYNFGVSVFITALILGMGLLFKSLPFSPLLKFIVFWPFCVVFLSSCIILGTFAFLIRLNNGLKRPEQLPYHLWLDRILPVTILILPSFIFIFILPSPSWMTIFFGILVTHCIIIIPLFHYWSNLRNWETTSDSKIQSWISPSLYKHIAIAMIYPSIFGVYFSSVRYLRLGEVVDYSYLLHLIPIDLIILLLFLFFSPYSIWFRMLLWKSLDMKNYLWDECYILLYSVNLKLLQKNAYFRLYLWLYKLSFIW